MVRVISVLFGYDQLVYMLSRGGIRGNGVINNDGNYATPHYHGEVHVHRWFGMCINYFTT